MNAPTWTVPATVVDVVDGDTIRLDLDLGWHVTFRARCRIAGIDAPELKTPMGKTAREYVAGLLPPGEQVTFVSHSLDKYGRPLGALIFGDEAQHDLGEKLVEEGHAIRYES